MIEAYKNRYLQNRGSKVNRLVEPFHLLSIRCFLLIFTKWLGKWSRKKAIMRSLFDGYLPNKRPKIFALDGSQGNCNVFTFLEIFEDMESIWKMELSPKEPSLWLGMILGKNKKKGGRKSPAARVDLCFIRISLGLKDPEGKSRSLKNWKHSNNGERIWKRCH